MSDETSIEEIFDKISNQLDEVDITATTSIIKTTTKPTVSPSQGKRNIFHQSNRNKQIIYEKIRWSTP